MTKMMYLFVVLISTVSAYNLTCPHLSQWRKRAIDVCSNVKSYVCLWDEIDDVYKERCTGPWPQQEGYKTVLNTGNFNRQPCAQSNFQPFQFPTIGTNKCIYQKSLCNGEGQVYGNNGSITQDRGCRCDYTRGYAFLNRNTDPCFCIPFKEDCSCYIKPCNDGNSLSPDYICTKDINPQQSYTCPVLSTKFDNISKEPIALKYEEEYTAFMVLASEFVLVVVIVTIALIVVLIFYWRNLDELFDKCQKGYVITDKPKTIIKNKGERVTITYELSKKGLPVEWYKQYRRITDMKDNYLKENTGNFYCLTVLYVSTEVAGIYYLTFDEVSTPITELQVTEITTKIIKEEGQSVIISYELPKTRLPMEWFKDGGPLVTGKDKNIHAENIQYSYKLTINYLSIKDAGSYKLKAGHMYSSTSLLKVKEITKEIIKEEGQNVIISYELPKSGLPMHWLKDGGLVVTADDTNFQAENIDCSYTLTIKYLSSEYDGNYQLKAGDITSSISIIKVKLSIFGGTIAMVLVGRPLKFGGSSEMI